MVVVVVVTLLIVIDAEEIVLDREARRETGEIEEIAADRDHLVVAIVSDSMISTMSVSAIEMIVDERDRIERRGGGEKRKRN